jgi:hypothetical protein
MAMMTDEEADRLDEKWTKNPPKVGPNGTGFFTKRKAAHMITVDSLSADWLLTKALAKHTTPSDIIKEMVQQEMVAAAR